MVSPMWRAASRSSVPVAVAYVTHTTTSLSSSRSQCEEISKEGFQPSATGEFGGQFPNSQLFQPKVPYPLWYRNWDGREPASTGNKDQDKEAARWIRKNGTTRHIILVRHGQYYEEHKDDSLRTLTPLGKLQANLTGKRLAEMMIGASADGAGPCYIQALRVSDLTRAKETAQIMLQHLPGVHFAEPDPALNEGRPCHHVPGVKANETAIELTAENHLRIEGAFRKYFYRADPPLPDSVGENHEFEIIVGHANVIRYFVCRALQMPPEAWLRFCPFNCSITYITIRPTGAVSCRMVGDIGHLSYGKTTFSSHHGFNW